MKYSLCIFKGSHSQIQQTYDIDFSTCTICPHEIRTFDGLFYKFHGRCIYTLVSYDVYDIQVQYNNCGGGSYMKCNLVSKNYCIYFEKISQHSHWYQNECIDYFLAESDFYAPKELWEAYSNFTVCPSIPLRVRSISSKFFEVGIPNLVCGCILLLRSAQYHFGSLWPSFF